MMTGDYVKCEKLSLEGKTIFEQILNKERLAGSHSNLGFSYMNRFRPLEAMPHFIKCYQLTDELGDSRRNAYALCNQGLTNALLGNNDQAIVQIQEGTSVFQKTKDKLLESYGNSLLCKAFLFMGDYENCLAVCQKTEEIALECNASFAAVIAFTSRAAVKIHQEEYEEAQNILKGISKTVARINFRGAYDFYYKTHSILALKTSDLKKAKGLLSQLLKGQLSQRNFAALLPSLGLGSVIACEERKFESSAILFFGVRKLQLELVVVQK